MLDSETTTVQPSVAVVGATGRVGRHVFQGALDRGFKVRALVRNPDKLSAVGDATVIQGDISDPERVRELVDGVGGAIGLGIKTQGKHDRRRGDRGASRSDPKIRDQTKGYPYVVPWHWRFIRSV